MKKITLLMLLAFLVMSSSKILAYDHLYVVGNACSAGWNTGAAPEMTMTEPGIFTWKGNLTRPTDSQQRFKFLVNRSWNPSITCRLNISGHLMIDSGIEYDIFVRAENDPSPDNAFQVLEDGVYTIVVNLNTMKMTCTIQNNTEKQNWEYVRPEIGAEGEGHVFPGVSAPFGMVKLGPDCSGKGSNAGWDRSGNIHGFSHTHVSGTGGGPKYGNILFQPIVGSINLFDYSSDRSNEEFALGLYGVHLNKYNVDVKLSALSKAGFHEYTFPESTSAKILIDAGSCLSTSIESQELLASGVKVISDSEVEGYSKVKGGWNLGAPYTVYFYAQVNTPAVGHSTWRGSNILSDDHVEVIGTEKTGAYFSYNTTNGQKIKLKVGISFISTEQAKKNIEELSSWNFDEIRDLAIAKWNGVLNTVKVEGSSKNKTILYTSIYHAFLQPTDRTGENPSWESSEPYFDDYYAIWDTFRATNPLFALLKPSREADIVRSLINIYEHEGYMPDGRSGNSNGRVQGGSNSDMLIADAVVKGLVGIDYEKGLNAMIKNAEVAPVDPRKEGRGGIADYNTKGYISTAYERSGTRTFEYSANDFAIATVAKHLGQEAVYEKYINRSSNWKNLWNNNVESLGFKGFLWPRKSNGDWVNLRDYSVFRREDWEGVVYESFPWEMSFYVPHDMAGLISRCGGEDVFTKRLDKYFNYIPVGGDPNAMGLFQVDNEPGFLAPTLYNYVNKPDKTAQIVRRVLRDKYNTTATGLPGNDDSGSMSAWYVFHSLGFFPNAGQDVYLISSPTFTQSILQLENGKTFEISAPQASETNIYIQSAILNGKTLNRCWLKHEEIMDGGKLEFIMGDKPSTWAYSGENPPSSPAGIDSISSEIESPKARIHSYSSQVSESESAYCLFAQPSKNIKWCDNKSTMPWVIFELTDTYLLDRFVFRDSKTVEGNNNVNEYWIYTSKTAQDNDWEEVIHRTDAGATDIKDDRLAQPKEAKFVKFVTKLPTDENAVRIYGFDIFGKLKEKTNRGNLLSVGKTVLKSSEPLLFYSSAMHILDGITNNTEYKWTLDKNQATSHYCVIDLENEYDIDEFKIYDSNNINGYNIYLSNTRPILEEITSSYDNNSSWTLVSSGDLNRAIKTIKIPSVKARYVKLQIPSQNLDTQFGSISEFEIINSTISESKAQPANNLFTVFSKDHSLYFQTNNGVQAERVTVYDSIGKVLNQMSNISGTIKLISKTCKDVLLIKTEIGDAAYATKTTIQ